MCETKTENLIECDFPDHTSLLKQAEEKLQNIKNEFILIKNNRTISDNSHTRLYEETISVLDWVGRMSNSIFKIRNDLELKYRKTYYIAPILAYKLFDEHYSRLHYPYNILKNRCFTLLDDLDNLYYKTFKKPPPNWEI